MPKANKVKTIAITGGVATGKSSAARFFKALGAVVLDTDEIAHMMIEKSGVAYKKVVKTFGRKILKKNGDIDRLKLAGLIFDGKNAAKKRKKLEKILHPQILESVRAVEKMLKMQGAKKLLIVEVPLLFESGWNKYFDKCITVYAKSSVQKKRIRKGLKNRIDAQLPLIQKVLRSDFVIDNSSSLTALKSQVKSVYKHLFTC